MRGPRAVATSSHGPGEPGRLYLCVRVDARDRSGDQRATGSRPIQGRRAFLRFSWSLAAVAAMSVFALPACSIKRMAAGSLADTLAGSGGVYASDDDPELIRAAVPFSLKTIESVLDVVPDHPGLLLSACSGFTQYSYAFVQADAEYLEAEES